MLQEAIKRSLAVLRFDLMRRREELDKTDLHVACDEGNVQKAYSLIVDGLEVDSFNVNAQDASGNTALHYAAEVS